MGQRLMALGAEDLGLGQKSQGVGNPGPENITQQPSSPELWRSSKDCMCCEEGEDEKEEGPTCPQTRFPKGRIGVQNRPELGSGQSWDWMDLIINS
ncbi:hypothetical protein BTVI_67139 [Pitangus sulphuratus]|nr:hypothetical protein BTVI_67139 [Pitangus sulphuratus]